MPWNSFCDLFLHPYVNDSRIRFDRRIDNRTTGSQSIWIEASYLKPEHTVQLFLKLRATVAEVGSSSSSATVARNVPWCDTPPKKTCCAQRCKKNCIMCLGLILQEIYVMPLTIERACLFFISINRYSDRASIGNLVDKQQRIDRKMFLKVELI